MKRIKIAILGMGRIGKVHADTILANSIVCFIILCSIILAINEVNHWPGLIYLFITPLIFLVFFIRNKIISKKS